MEARKVTFTAKPGTFRDAVRAYKKYKEEKEQRQLTRCLTLCEACIDSAEREQARPEVKPIQTRMLPDMPLEEDFPDMDKELYTPEEAYELTMKDIKAVYDKEYAV
jgi:hypothetical protein